MSNANLILRFDGPLLQAHAIDVTLIGPALFAFGELCSEANRVINAGETKVQVLLHADVKANCVTISLEVVQSLWQAASHLIHSKTIADAREILELIGIFKTTVEALGGGGLIAYLRWKKDRKVASIQVKQTDGGNVYIVNVEGNNSPVTISQPIYDLSRNTKVVESLKILADPVSEANGIDQAVFFHEAKEELKIDRDCADDLKKSFADSEEAEPQTFTAHLVIYGPVLDKKSKKWKFRFGDRIEFFDISETSIAEDAMKRGKVVCGDTYKVSVEMKEHGTKMGGFKMEYKIKKVLEFRPGNEQTQTALPFPH